MWAHTMTVEDYQDLIDRGWRRSGKYCYKPTMNVTCCPQYTIRHDAPNFQMSKSQKKVIKCVNRYLIHGIKRGKQHGDKELVDRETETSTEEHVVENLECLEKAVPTALKLVTNKTGEGSAVLTHDIGAKSSNCLTKDSTQDVGKEKDQKFVKFEKEERKGKSPKPGLGPDPNRSACEKAKNIRREKKLKKLASKSEVSAEDGTSAVKCQKSQNYANEMKTLEDYLSEPEKASSVAHKLEIRLVRSQPKSQAFVTSFKEAYKVYHKYQTVIHKDPPEKPNERQYSRFLMESPLQHKEGRLQQGYGSFHQHYILDGKIIAVGVVDILPHCLSSVYLYYDPDYSFLSLGTYSALREIAFVRELNKMDPEVRFYYMGFYIHSCQKMRYKGQYVPSFVLCPEAFTWVPIEKCRPKLDVSKYARLEESNKEDENGVIDLDRVPVLHDGEAMPYEVYRFMNPNTNDEEEIREYATFTGRVCAQRMLLYRK